MASNQPVWGIDLGRCALKAIKLRQSAPDKVEIIAYEYIEHAKILSQPDADRGELIRAALEKFLSHNDISKDAVVVGVPGQHTLARFTKLPPVAPKRIPDIVRYEADQQIPFDMDEVIWDYQTFQREGTPDLEVGIFAMKRELIREHLLHFEQASIEPIAVQTGPLAIYNAAHYDEMLGPETTILLDVGAENTDLVIATASTFWTRTVPMGGNSFTEALVKSFKLAFSKAENLKRTADSSKYARQIFQAMRPVFADLVQELQRSIGFYSSTHRDTKVTKVVCMGNACKLPGLQKYLQQNLGLPVERPESFKKAPVVGAAAGEFQENLLSFGVAYGLAVQGMDLAPVTSNLLPVEIAKQLVWQKKRPAFAAAAACLFLAGGLIWFRQSADLRALAAGAQGQQASISGIEDAWNLINSGPSPSLSDRGAAVAVRTAAGILQKGLNDLSGRGGPERAQAEDLIKHLHNKVLVPAILQTIHESVPRPEGALGQATTQAEVLAALGAGAPPRSERHEVLIERIDLQFHPNINAFEIWENLASAEPPINSPDAALPAFKIEITCRTPNKGGLKFISSKFLDVLRKNGRQPGAGFYFDRVYLFDGRPLGGTETAGGGASSSLSTAGGSRGRGFGPLGGGVLSAPATVVAASRNLDPITNEPMDEDWRFVIWVDAIPGELPQTEKTGHEEGGD